MCKDQQQTGKKKRKKYQCSKTVLSARMVKAGYLQAPPYAPESAADRWLLLWRLNAGQSFVEKYNLHHQL